MCAWICIKTTRPHGPRGTSGHTAIQTTAFCNNCETQHDQLLQRIPELDDLQASWLLLLFCASPRCNYQLRMLSPHDTAHFAAAHDVAVAACFTRLLDTAPPSSTSSRHGSLAPSHGRPRPDVSSSHRHAQLTGPPGLTFLLVLQAQAPQQAAAIHHMLSNPNRSHNQHPSSHPLCRTTPPAGLGTTRLEPIDRQTSCARPTTPSTREPDHRRWLAAGGSTGMPQHAPSSDAPSPGQPKPSTP